MLKTSILNILVDRSMRVNNIQELIPWMLLNNSVAYRRGGRGGDLPRAALWGGGKKGKKKKRKKEKREKGKKGKKEKFGEACNYSKTEMKHLSCGAPMHVKPKMLAPQAI